MIRVASLHKSYPPDRVVLRGLDLDVAAGEFFTVVGRSGSGKTTLLQILGGLDSSYDGEVEVAGRALHGLDDAELSGHRNATVGFVFQAYHLLDHSSVSENAALPSLFARGDHKLEAGGARARAAEVLERVGLGDRGAERPSRLSGGERQRLAIARALFHRPPLLLCDEPTGNLDAATAAEVLELLDSIHRQDGVTVVAASHDEAITAVADRVLRLHEGSLAALGESE